MKIPLKIKISRFKGVSPFFNTYILDKKDNALNRFKIA